MAILLVQVDIHAQSQRFMVLLKAALNTLPSARGPCYRAIMGSELAPVTWNILESLIEWIESLEIHGETVKLNWCWTWWWSPVASAFRLISIWSIWIVNIKMIRNWGLKQGVEKWQTQGNDKQSNQVKLTTGCGSLVLLTKKGWKLKGTPKSCGLSCSPYFYGHKIGRIRFWTNVGEFLKQNFVETGSLIIKMKFKSKV